MNRRTRNSLMQAHPRYRGELVLSRSQSLLALLSGNTVCAQACPPGAVAGVPAIRVTVKDEGFNRALFNMTLPDDPREIRKRRPIIVNALSEKIEFDVCRSQVTACLNPRENEKHGR